MLRADLRRTGHYGLFAGQSSQKQVLWLILPGAFACYVVCAVAAVRLTNATSLLQRLLADCFSVDWERDQHTVRRVAKHSNRFGPFAFAIGLALTIFYISLSVQSVQNNECIALSVDIAMLGEHLFPWHTAHGNTTSFVRHESAVQWLFMLFVGSLGAAAIHCWDRYSAFGTDRQCTRAQQAYQGMCHIFALEKAWSTSYRCIDRWAANALPITGLTDREGRREYCKSKTGALRVTSFWLLHIPAALVLTWPSILYSMSKNIPSDNVLIKACSSTLVVVVINVVLPLLLLNPIVSRLSKYRQRTLPDDEISLNKQRAETMLALSLLSTAVVPVVLTVLLDGTLSHNAHTHDKSCVLLRKLYSRILSVHQGAQLNHGLLGHRGHGKDHPWILCDKSRHHIFTDLDVSNGWSYAT